MYVVTEVEVELTRFFTGKSRRWILSGVLSITSMLLLARDLPPEGLLSVLFYPSITAAMILSLTSLHGDGPFGDAGIVLFLVVFYVATFVTWTLAWYVALSVLLRGIKRIRDRPG